MLVRLGYVANTMRLEDCSPSKTVTLATIQKIPGRDNQIGRLVRIARENLVNTLRILKINLLDGIMVYRFTSKLVPLCTHPLFDTWDYLTDLKTDFQNVGNFVNRHGIRVSLHPDHFTLLNSSKPEVQRASFKDLEYHANIMDAMGIGPTGRLVMHIGGKYESKQAALARFKDQFGALLERIRKRIVLENDDRCYSVPEVLPLCQALKIPMVLDIHHARLLNGGEDWSALLPEIFKTWERERPKIHISSPKSAAEPRSHADFIDPKTAADFLSLSKILNVDFDMMIEAKQKDSALIKLSQDLKKRGFTTPSPGEIHL